MNKFCLALLLCCGLSVSTFAQNKPKDEKSVSTLVETLARTITATDIVYMLDSYSWLNPKVLNCEIAKIVDFNTPAQLRVKIFAKSVPKDSRQKLLLWDARRSLQAKQVEDKELPDYWLDAVLSSEEEKLFATKYRALLSERMTAARVQNLAWLEKKENVNVLKSIAPQSKSRKEVGSKVMQANEYESYKYISKLTKEGDYAKATQLVLAMDKTNLHPLQANKWWRVQHILSRENIKLKQYKTAYKLARVHAADDPSIIADAEWLCGWLALRYLHNSAMAIDHFHKVYKVATMSDTKAKAAYWLWRGYVVSKQEIEAKEWLNIAIAYKGFFYGQVAAMESGRHDANIFVNNEPIKVANSEAFAKAKKHLIVANELQRINKHDLARKFTLIAADYKLDTAHSNLLADIVAKNKNTELLVTFAKEIANRHNINLKHGYPHNLSITNNKDRLSLYYGIIRQESNFNPSAKSQAGAYGLMQLMPQTATMLAKKLNIKSNYYRLYPKYNVYSGVAYIDGIKERFGGYIPAIGAYNAGEKNAAKWVEVFGDPHMMKDTDSIIDWIESVPFGETRFYIKKVLSNMIIYDALLAKKKSGSQVKVSWSNFKHFLS